MTDIADKHNYTLAAERSVINHGSTLDPVYDHGEVLSVSIEPSSAGSNFTVSQNGYQLFQQAIMQQRIDAWEQIYQLYVPLVRKWVSTHPCFENTGEEIAYFVNRAFEKMWCALTPEKFAKFPELKSLLAYLQMCVNSAIIDHLRAEKRYRHDLALADDLHLGDFCCSQNQFWYEAQRLHFWECICKRLKNETEYKLLYYRFMLDIKPHQLCSQFPDIFPDITVVYTLTQNILLRLRRDPALAIYRHDFNSNDMFDSLGG